MESVEHQAAGMLPFLRRRRYLCIAPRVQPCQDQEHLSSWCAALEKSPAGAAFVSASRLPAACLAGGPSCRSRLFSLVSSAFFLLFHGSQTIFAFLKKAFNPLKNQTCPGHVHSRGAFLCQVLLLKVAKRWSSAERRDWISTVWRQERGLPL